MRDSFPRRAVTIVACLAIALALTFLAYRRIAHPTQQEEDVPDAVAEVLDLSLEEGTEETEGPAEIELPASQPQVEAGDSDAPVMQDGPGLTVTDEGERVFSMPEGVDYVEGVALLQVGEDATAQDVYQLLSETPGVVAREVSDEEIASGIIEVEVAEGTSVEDAVNELLASPVVQGAQPDFEYVVMVGDEADLRAVLGEALDPQPEPMVELDAIEADEPSAESDDQPTEAAEGPNGVDVAADEIRPDDAGELTPTDAGQTEAWQDDTSEGDVPIDEGRGDVVVPDGADADAQGLEPSPDEQEPAETEDEAGDAEGVTEEPTDDVVQEGASELLAAVTVNDPWVKGTSANPAGDWALASLRAYQAWGIVRCNQKVTVAVLDTGFQANHADLSANVRSTYNAATGTSDVSPISGVNYSHGTHVAGVVSAKANNGVGVAGVSYDAGLMLIKVASSTGKLTTTNLVKAYDYVMANASTYNVRVINVSMGINSTDVDIVLNDRINQAYDQGIVTVAAAGNSDVNGGIVPYAEYPGDEGNVVSVINLQPDGSSVSRYSSSNYNLPGMRNKNVSAPGTDIFSTVPTNEYSSLTGTSMAAPFVSGVLALEFAAKPSLTAGEAVSCLYASAADIGPKGFDEEYGWGEVDAYSAVYLAKNGSVPDVPRDDQAAVANAVAASEVQARIGALPQAAEVTRAHAPAIRAARAAYNALTSAQKKLVDVTRLSAAERAIASKTATVNRLWGQNAYDTMRAILCSSVGFASGRGGTVIVATGEGYWDALAASGLAGIHDAPVLITQKSALSPQAKAEVERLKPTQILVMGGPLAITDTVLAQLRSTSGVEPRRVFGQTAPDTAVKIYQSEKGRWADTAIVTTSNGYWDALSVAPYAYAKRSPIFLTSYADDVSGRVLSDQALSAIKSGGFSRVLVIGGTLAIPDTVIVQLKDTGVPEVRRLWGQTAIDTSVVVAQFCLSEGMRADGMGVATSNGYWDALTGASVCGKSNAVLVLVANENSPSITTFVKGNRLDIDRLYVFGGTLAVSSASESAIKAALK